MTEEIAFPPDAPLPLDDSPIAPVSKLTVVERVYHRQGNNPPLQIESKFEHVLSVDEPVYFRPGSKVSGDWTEFDFGWLGRENTGTIVIQNITGRYLQRIPTAEQKRELEAKVLEIGIVAPIPLPFAIIPPKQNLRLNLMPGLSYLVRSQSGQAEFNFYAIPK